MAQKKKKPAKKAENKPKPKKPSAIMRQIGENNFHLTMLSIKDQGAETLVEWTQKNETSNSQQDYSLKEKTIPHVDLINALKVFKKAMLKAARHDDENGKEMDSQVTKVSVGGSDELYGITISGKLKGLHGGMMAINTPFIHLKRNVYGFEQDLLDALLNLENEAMLFIREGKKDQATMLHDPSFEESDNQKEMFNDTGRDEEHTHEEEPVEETED